MPRPFGVFASLSTSTAQLFKLLKMGLAREAEPELATTIISFDGAWETLVNRLTIIPCPAIASWSWVRAHLGGTEFAMLSEGSTIIETPLDP